MYKTGRQALTRAVGKGLSEKNDINLETENISRSQPDKKRWRQDLSRQQKQPVQRPRGRREIVPLEELKQKSGEHRDRRRM